MNLTPRKKVFVDTASEMYGAGAILTKTQTKDAAEKAGVPFPTWFRKNCSVGYNAYKLPGEVTPTPVAATPTESLNTTVNLVASSEIENLVPTKFEGFVEWGHFSTLTKIIKSGLFYPVFITGLSGNGKTLMVEQIHAKFKKELIRVNITIETDEDDLLGGFRLVNGETKFVPGPVIEAMERGCTLLLDECDLGSNKLLALQPVLEGKGVYLKKVNKWVTPAAGFNVIATANTKGKGSDDGRFIGTNVLNEAFLERFPVTFEQDYPTVNNEVKILLAVSKTLGKVDEDFCKRLVDWADIIRKTFYDGGIEDIISTRRLVHIIRAFSIFKDKAKAIQVCTNRFDDETKQSFLELYDKVDADFQMPENDEEKKN